MKRRGRVGGECFQLVAQSQTFSPDRVTVVRAFCAGTSVSSLFGKTMLYTMFLRHRTLLAAQVKGFRGNTIAKALNTLLGTRVLRLFDSKSC